MLSGREIVTILIGCTCLSPVGIAQEAFPSDSTSQLVVKAEHTQDFSRIVVPITSAKITASMKLGMSGKPGPSLGVDAKFGTGFCLDAACRFIATNYHVAVTTRVRRIQRENIVQRYLATGPDDKGATPNFIPNVDVVPFAIKRDLAIFELRRPLRDHHGLGFNLDELEVGQEVDIYGYPKGVINPFRKLTRFPAKFKGPMTSGLLAFDYELPVGQPIRIAGSSGGIVVDRKTEKIVGILSGSTETTAGAVPVQTLVEFVTRVQPFLAQRIFPATKQVPPICDDIYPKFVPTHFEGLQHRSDEPDDVKTLRKRAQFLVESLRNFIAVESFAWGAGDKEPNAEAAYEVRVSGVDQLFREYPDGKKESKEVPWPPIAAWILPVDEWSQLPQMIGTELRLKINQAPDVLVNERRVKVFQYYANVEDKVCQFRAIVDYGFFTINSDVDLACYGEVWTDEDMNILRMSQQLDFSRNLRAYNGWESRIAVLTYGWLELADQKRWLAPLTTYVEGRKGEHVYWCRGHFTNYHVFEVGARIAAINTVTE
jgi:hypothetical protein